MGAYLEYNAPVPASIARMSRTRRDTTLGPTLVGLLPRRVRLPLCAPLIQRVEDGMFQQLLGRFSLLRQPLEHARSQVKKCLLVLASHLRHRIG